MHFLTAAAVYRDSGMTPGEFYRGPYLRMNRVWATRPLVLQSAFERRRGPGASMPDPLQVRFGLAAASTPRRDLRDTLKHQE